MTSLKLSRWWTLPRGRLAMLVLAAAGVVPIFISTTSEVWFELGQVGRLMSALLIGFLIGRRIEYARYFWPLILVATVTDLGSVMLTGGFSHELAQEVMSEPAVVHPLLVYVSTPFGSPMPLIGLADIVFVALCLTAGERLSLSQRRVVLGLGTGIVVGLVVLTISLQPIPMLPFLGVGVGLCLGRSIKPKVRELSQAVILLGVLSVIWFIARL